MGPAWAALTTADRSLVRARLAWGSIDDWNGFATPWADRLRAAWAERPPEGDDPAKSLDVLKSEYAAEARPDLARIHPSWLVRALEGESPAVRRVVADHVALGVASAIAAEAGPVAVGPPHPAALWIALTLWTERLVGGPARRPDDPPVVRLLSLQDGPGAALLLGAVGLTKLALIWSADDPGSDDPGLALDPRLSGRLRPFGEPWPIADLGAVPIAWARHDRGLVAADPRRLPIALGLLTLGRLLADVEAHRARWALQHLPYDLAKSIRARMDLRHPLADPVALLEGESAVLRVASFRMRAEGVLGSSEEEPG